MLFSSSIAEQIDAFLRFKEGLGHKQSSYLSVLSQFDEFCAKQYPEMIGLQKDCVIKWAVMRETETQAGFCRRVTVIRQLGEYISLTAPAYILPAKFTSGKSVFLPYLFSDCELQKLFEATEHISPSRKNPFRPIVVPVIFRLIYTCGLRPGEGRLIKCANVNLQTGEILIEGTKTHKQRIVVMSDDMLSLCREYNRKRNILFPDSQYFFSDLQGQPYTNQWLLKIFKHCWRKANPDIPLQQLPNVRVYDLRHRFATAILHRWQDEGRDIAAMLPYLRTYMGHERFNETLYYIHLLPENLAVAMEKDSLVDIIPEVDA